ncbi:hypothetical protein E3P99_00423 [Wallemia hederae]|uniref:MalT-like TPR region domain-containing protein n=1 Tax=Wallemia hederae TaxID=1540922 RepID=A0A4T0FX82_9BASI|nr:hypothetical protein E3P99_00423 [Wallemia hederae]
MTLAGSVRQRVCSRGSVSSIAKPLSLQISPASLRSFSQSAQPQQPQQPQQQPPKGIRQGTLFAILACTGLGATIYAVLEYYSAFTEWPEAVRGDIRFAVKAHKAGDTKRALEGYRKVIDTGRELSEEEYKAIGVSKAITLTGVQIACATLLSLSERPSDAHHELADALSYLLSGDVKKGDAETHRCIALAVKLGDMAYRARERSQAEQYYEWALAEMFRVSRAEKERKENDKEHTKGDEQLNLMTHQLNLPKWVSVSDLGGTLERLAALYSEQGRPEAAAPLYMQAISLLMPPQPFRHTPPSTSDRCRAALLMTNLSSVLTSHPSSKNLDNALQWANKAVELVEYSQNSDDDKVCNHTLAVGLFNVGVLHEMLNAPNAAVDSYGRAYRHSDKHNLIAAKLQSKEALRRVENGN